jgi:hypothetical protein
MVAAVVLSCAFHPLRRPRLRPASEVGGATVVERVDQSIAVLLSFEISQQLHAYMQSSTG